MARPSKPTPERPELARLLEASRHYVMTPEDFRQQRISWAYGNSMENPRITREMVEAEHDRIYGKPVMPSEQERSSGGGYVPFPPTVIRDPELAAVLAELQRIRGACDRIEEKLSGHAVSVTLIPGKVEKGGHNTGPSQVVNRPPPPQSSYPIKRWWRR